MENKITRNALVTFLSKNDLCFDRPGMNAITCIHYNPDSVSGGQFVIQELHYALILKSVMEAKDKKSFFELLDDGAPTTFADMDTTEYECYCNALCEDGVRSRSTEHSVGNFVLLAIVWLHKLMDSQDPSDTVFFDENGDYYTVDGNAGPGPEIIPELGLELGDNDLALVRRLFC